MHDLTLVFKALGDSIRLEIVQMLLGKELCVCEILDAFKLSQPAVSHHLKILKQAGVLLDRKEGKWVYYKLNPDVIGESAVFLQNIKEGCREIICCKSCSP